MKKQYLAPGNYMEETSLLPKSVAQVETAVPAFIGFTSGAVFNGQDFHLERKIHPLEINSLSEYEKIFGGPSIPSLMEVKLNAENSVEDVKIKELNYLYYSVRLFFDNGGTSCIIVSVGSYDDINQNKIKQQLLNGLASLEKTDAPTLLVIPDVVKLSYSDAGEVHKALLAQCHKLKNRFAILDLVSDDNPNRFLENQVELFRKHAGDQFLSYGAAYCPWLTTSYFHPPVSRIILQGKYLKNGKWVKDLSSLFTPYTLKTLQTLKFDEPEECLEKVPVVPKWKGINEMEDFATALYQCFKHFYHLKFKKCPFSPLDSAEKIHARYIASGTYFHRLIGRFYSIVSINNFTLEGGDFSVDFKPLTVSLSSLNNGFSNKIRAQNVSISLKSLARKIEKLVLQFYSDLEHLQRNLLSHLKKNDAVYKNITEAIEKQKITVPPGGAIAGIYTVVDREHGVWKSPANLSLRAVTAPSVAITDKEQRQININLLTGKPVNILRFFSGKGVVARGAQTLAGYDDQWKYIATRRLFIMVEQSVREATSQFIFEVNELSTWLRVKTVIEQFLASLWQKGALQGTKPEQAFYVKVGLGETMSYRDLLKGIMITEIGLAAIRPAEFIVLTIVHKMQKN